VRPTIKRIFDKYNGQLTGEINNQKTNNYLKEIGKKIQTGKKKLILNEDHSKTITRVRV
jgi:hypothetical protein